MAWPYRHDKLASPESVADQIVAGWYLSTTVRPRLEKRLASLSQDDWDDWHSDHVVRKNDAHDARDAAFDAAMSRSGAHVLRSLIPNAAATQAMMELASVMDARDRAGVIALMMRSADDLSVNPFVRSS